MPQNKSSKGLRITLSALSIQTLIILASLATSGFAATQPLKHDFTETLPATSSQSEYVTVTLGDPPAATYAGGIPGLKATKPERGQKLNANDEAVRSYVSYLDNTHRNYRSYVNSKAPQAEIVREFYLTTNGFAIRLNGANPQTLSQGPGVRTVAYSWLYRPTMDVSTGLIGATELWRDAGGRRNAGEGIKIGIIDTGIDETHPFFSCKTTITHKVYASGVAFDPTNVLVFDHGTHVSGTAAGCLTRLKTGPITGDISGVAPAAELHDYNVFPGFGAGFVAFGGSAFSHDIIQALEDTVRDGMDVVNMSLGGGVQGPHDSLAEAVDSTADAGLVVAVAAGNSGPGDSTVESPGSARGALTAGASTNPHFIGVPVTVGASAFSAATGDFNSFGVVTAAYTVTSPANGCSSITANLSGKIALIDRGVCTFTTKIRNAQAAGAIGVLVVNNVAGDPIGMGHDGTSPFPTIPAAMLSKNDGNSIKPSGTMSIDGTSPREIITTNADIIAGFSSRGPTPFTYLIKPDITAPGVNVYSSVFNGQFAMFQGTSMATPHVAGSAALLLQLHPDWSPDDIKSALVNTAKRPVFDHLTGTNPTGVLTRGGGRIDLQAADNVPLTILPASASFGLWIGNKPVTGRLDLSILNVSNSHKTCGVTITGPTIVTISATSVSLDSGQTTTVTLTLSAGQSNTTPSGDYTGDVVIDCGGTTLRAPWWTRIQR